METIGKNLVNVHVRRMVRRDMLEVLEIENQSFEFPWSDEDFVRYLRQRNCIGTVAESGKRVVGFMVYELLKNQMHLLSIAVRPEFQRRGVGSQMMLKLVCKLATKRRNNITLEVRERNLPGQLFFKSCGFLARSVLRDFYCDTTEDAYRMQFLLHPDKDYVPGIRDRGCLGPLLD